jgi:DNA-binding transcriptional LysR family regulator
MTDQIRTGPDWEDIRIFIALARHGSMSAAALIRDGADDSPKGLVRINAPPSLAQGFLVARLATLVAQHPALDIDIATDFRAVSLERREADIALRFGRPHDGDVIARFLVTLGFGFYASAAWRQRIDDGAAPVFVCFDEANAHLPEATQLAQHHPRARMGFRANNQLAQAIAAKGGAGIALLPHFVGRHDDALVPCPLNHASPSRELWLLTRRLDRKDLPTRTTVDFLVQVFADEGALFGDR